jgi:hypothetical protein
MSKKSKRRKKKPLPNPKQNGGHDDKCYSSGNTHVRGEVEVSFPPSLVQKHDTEQQENNSRENVKRIVSILTLMGVFAAAGFAGWQGCKTRDIAKTARDQLVRSVRPWVGLDDTKPGFGLDIKPLVRFNPDGKAFALYTIYIRLFGTSPAQDVYPIVHLVVTQNYTDVIAQQKIACSEYDQSPHGQILFLGSNPIIGQQSPTIPPVSAKFLPGREKESLSAWVVACIGFRDQFFNIWHTTYMYGFDDPTTHNAMELLFKPDTEQSGGIWEVKNGSVD